MCVCGCVVWVCVCVYVRVCVEGGIIEAVNVRVYYVDEDIMAIVWHL